MEDDDYAFVDEDGSQEAFENPLYRSGSGRVPTTGMKVFQTNPVWSPAAVPSRQAADQEAAAPRGEAVEAAQQRSFAEIWQSAQSSSHESTEAVVPSYVSTLEGQAAELREQAAGQQQRHGARSLRLLELAEDLEAESATWRLFWTLHGVEDGSYPGGAGGPAISSAGAARTARQKAADLLERDQGLNQLARVVTWLEELAGRQLDIEEQAAARAGGAAAAFSRREGLPLGTLGELQRNPAARAGLPQTLDPDAATRQGRRWAEADRKEHERISERVWRLLRAGRLAEARQLCRGCGQPWRAASLGSELGPGPISLGAAAIKGDSAPEEEARQALGEEVDLGGGSVRAMWRWTCFQAAELLREEDVHEAGVYGMLGGNLAVALPLCATWHDRLWAHCRGWLEAAVDTAVPPAGPTAKASAMALVTAAAATTPRPAIAAAGASLLTRPSGTGAAEQALGSWADLDAAVGGNLLLAERTLSFREQQQVLQWALILAAVEGDHSHLLLDVLPACLKQEVSPGEERRQPLAKLRRLAGHLTLALEDCGLIPPLHAARAWPASQDLLEAGGALLLSYLNHLLAAKQYVLLPAYACRLAAPQRRRFCTRLLLQLTLESEAGLQQETYLQLSDWLHQAAELQAGDIAPDELSIILREVADTSRSDLATGPMLRAMAAGWLWLGPTTVLPACQHTNALLREFALGPPAAAAAALALLAGLPEEVQRMMQETMQTFEDPAWSDGLAAAAQLEPLEAQQLKEELLQLFAWWQYFHLDRGCTDWRAAVEGCSEEEEAGILKEEGRDLLAAYLVFLAGEGNSQLPPLELVCPGGSTVEEPLRLWAGVDGDSSEANPTMSRADAEALVADIHSQLCPHMQGGGFELQVSIAEDGAPLHVIELMANAASREEMQRAVALLGLAIKGDFGGAEHALQVINIEGDSSAMGQLCRAIAYPAAVLNAAKIRLTLVQLGVEAEVGSELLPLLAGTDQDTDFHGLSPHFSPHDLQLYLEAERLTRIQQLLRAQGC